MTLDIIEDDLQIFYSEKIKENSIYRIFINKLVNDVINHMCKIYKVELVNIFFKYIESLENKNNDVPYICENINDFDLKDFDKKFNKEQDCDYDSLKKIFNNNIETNINNINDIFDKYNKNKINIINNRKIKISTKIDKNFSISMSIINKDYNEEKINELIYVENEFENDVYKKYNSWYENLVLPKSTENDNIFDNFLYKIMDDENKEITRIEKNLKKIYKLPDINCCKNITKCILKKINLEEIQYKKEINLEKCMCILHININYNLSMMHNCEPNIRIEKIC